MGLLNILKSPKDLPIRAQLRQGQKRSQFVMGFNLCLIAVALPMGWNFTVKKRWEEYQAKTANKEKGWVEAQRQHEKLAIQLIVNERRAARGLPPYPYDIDLKPTASTHALLSAISSVDAQMKADKAAVLRELTVDRRGGQEASQVR